MFNRRPSGTRAVAWLGMFTVLVAMLLTAHLASGQTEKNTKIYPIHAVSTVLSLNVLRQAAAAYSAQHPGFDVQAVTFSSSAGVVNAFLGGGYDLVLSTAPLSPVQRVTYPQYKEFPIMASAVVPIYNLPASAGTAQLIMPIQVICDIERGVVTNWNDTRLQAANPALVMPDLGISVYHLSIPSSSSEMIAALCGKIDPAFKVAIPRSQAPPFPTKKYFKSGTGSTSDVLASNVVDVVGAYSLATLQNVLSIKAKVAAIKTVTGVILNPTVNAISLNVLELVKPLGPTESTYDLSNPQTPGAWPICTMLSLQIDAINAVTTCATKALMMQFLIWFYTSATVKALANSLNIAVVPELFITETGLLHTLQSAISCSGQALISSATSSGFVQGFSATQPLLTAYSNFYQQTMTDYVYSFSSASETLATARVVAGEVDLAIVNTKQLSADDVSLMNYNQGGVFLPAFYTGVAVIFTLPSAIVANYSKWNALTDTRGGLPQLLPLAIDLETVAGIFAGQITQWTDPAILATSPQLGPWFAAHPAVNINFKPIVCCSNTMDTQAAGVMLLQTLNQTKVAQDPATSKFFTLPVSWAEQQKASTAFTLLDIEARMSAKMTSAQTGGASTISYRLITSSATDPASEFRITQTVNGASESVSPQPSAFKPCIMSGWSTQQLTDPKWNPGPIAGCYPLASPMSFGVGMAYEAEKCDRGNRSLNYFNWINTNPALSAAAINAGVYRISDVPEIQLAIETQLNKATCDGETLLITLPTIWTVNTAITGFGISVMAILLAVFFASAIGLVVYRQRTVLRSSSVPFLGLILLGLSMLAMSIGAWANADVSEGNCGAFMWLASLGFSLVFVPFFAKTYRIYLIFSRQRLQVVKLSNRRLFALVGAFFVAELIVMIAWSATSPLKPVTYYRNISGVMHEATHCSVDSQGMTFVVIEAVYKGLLLVTGSLLAFRTRKVSSNFNESSSIAMSIYSCLFSSVIIGALIYFVSAFEDTLILLLLFLIFWLATVTWALVFGAKFYELFSRSEADAAQASKIESLQTEKSQGGFSFISVAAMPLPIVKTYIQALESQLSKAKRQLSVLLGTAAGFAATAGHNGGAQTGSLGKRTLQVTNVNQKYEKSPAYVPNDGETNSNNDDADLIQEADLVTSSGAQQPLGDLTIRPPSVVSMHTQQPAVNRSPNRSPSLDLRDRNVQPDAAPRSPSLGNFVFTEPAGEKIRPATERKPLLIGAQKEVIEGGEAGSASSSLVNWPGKEVFSTPSTGSTIVAAAPPAAEFNAARVVNSPPQPVSTALRPSSRATLTNANATPLVGGSPATSPQTAPSEEAKDPK